MLKKHIELGKQLVSLILFVVAVLDLMSGPKGMNAATLVGGKQSQDAINLVSM